jgi:hypothetical protein
MICDPNQVIVLTEQHPILHLQASSVHHRDFPEVHAEGPSPEDAAARLAELLSQGLESAPSRWRREILERAIADVRAFAARPCEPLAGRR